MKRYSYRKKMKRLVAALCVAAVLGNVCSMKTEAHYTTDVNYMHDKAVSVNCDSKNTTAVVASYDHTKNADPYVLALPYVVTFPKSGKGITYKIVGVKDSVFYRTTPLKFSMIYVATHSGFAIGKAAFKNVHVSYTNDKVTDMDVTFRAPEDKAGNLTGGVTDIGAYAFQDFQVPYGYMHMDKVTGKIGPYAFQNMEIKENFDISQGEIPAHSPDRCRLASYRHCCL